MLRDSPSLLYCVTATTLPLPSKDVQCVRLLLI